jgi:hypothetical protein
MTAHTTAIAQCHGKTAEQIREVREDARIWCRLVSKSAETIDDVMVANEATAVLDALDHVLETLRLTEVTVYEGEDTEFLRRIVEAAMRPQPPRAPRIWHYYPDHADRCPCTRLSCGAVATDQTTAGCPEHDTNEFLPVTGHVEDFCLGPDNPRPEY